MYSLRIENSYNSRVIKCGKLYAQFVYIIYVKFNGQKIISFVISFFFLSMVEDSRFSASRLLDLFVIEKLTNTAKCSLCSSSFTYNSQKTGTSHMSRHITNKHPEEYNKMKRRLECRDDTQSSILRCFKKKTGLSAMPERRRLAMLISCGDHVLPLNFLKANLHGACCELEVVQTE